MFKKSKIFLLLITAGSYTAYIGADSTPFVAGNVILYLQNKTKESFTIEDQQEKMREISPGKPTKVGSISRKPAGWGVAEEHGVIKIMLPKLQEPLFLLAASQSDGPYRGALVSDIDTRTDQFTPWDKGSVIERLLPFSRPAPTVKFFKQNKDCNGQCLFYKATATHTRGDFWVTPDIYYTIEEVAQEK